MTEPSARVAELLRYMDRTRDDLVAAAKEMNPAFAALRPRSESWSAADTLAHLAVVERVIVKLVKGAVEKAREEGVGPETSTDSVMSSLDRYRLTEVVMKIRAPASIAPPADQSVEQSLDSLASTRAALRELLIGASDMDLTKVRRPHPMLGELDIYQWALFDAQHEERHRKQMERTLKEVTERAAECAPIV